MRSGAPGTGRSRTGACPRSRTTRPAPRSRSSDPANAEHGDFASNLAMKLARPYRDGAARDRGRRSRPSSAPRPDDPGATPIASAEVAPPGFLNLRLADAALEAVVARDPRATRRRGARSPAATPRVGQRRVRVGQPDRAAARRQRRGAPSSATCSAGSSRRAASGSRASTTSTTRAARSGTSARRSRRSSAGEPVPEDGYQGDYVDDLAADAAGRRLGRGDGAGRRHRRHRRPLGGRARPRGHRGQPRRRSASGSTSGRARPGSTTEGWVERAVERLRERGHVYEQDGAIWFRSTAFGDDKDRVIYPLERRADLLRGRHRLRDREVQPRLRPPDLHLGRRPPRDGRARPERGRRRWATTRTRSRCCSTRGSASCATARRSRCRKRAGEFITLDELLAEVGVDAARWFFASRAPTSASTSTSSWPRSSRTRTPSTTSSTRTPGSRRSCARRPRPGWRRRPT